jgi:hypothetical protein
MIRIMMLVVMCGLLACSEDKKPTAPEPVLDINTRSREGDTYEAEPNIAVDLRYRLIAFDDLRNEVLGSYELTLTSTKATTITATVGRLVFEDASGLQIAEYVFADGGDKFTVDAFSSRTREGNFTISLPSLVFS